MSVHAGHLLKDNQALYISEGYPDRAFRIDRQGAVHFLPLASNQEESVT